MSANENTEKKNKKRKRTTNTTREQYEIYLSAMENDYALQSGTINPTLGENYLSQKWEELGNKLNAIGNGPKLTSDEWKKRFTDWKYSTKNKYRKMSEHRKGTGSGPQLDIKLSELEERALSLWGKITVTGNQEITNYEGIEIDNFTPLNNVMEYTDNIILEFQNEKDDGAYLDVNVNTENIISNCRASSNVINPIPGTSGNNHNNEKSTPRKDTAGFNKSRKYLPSRTKPLSVLTEKLLETSKNSMNVSAEFNSILSKFSDNYIKVKQEEIELEKTKLRFEIAKFKINNPEFTFDI